MMLNGRPGDERGLIHKKIARIGKGIIRRVVPGASVGFDIVDTIGDVFGGGGGGGKLPGETFVQFRARMGIVETCVFPNKRDAADNCVGMSPAEIAAFAITGPTGNGNGICTAANCAGICVGDVCTQAGSPAGPPGQAVMGRFGAALEPQFFARNVRTCLPGMVLGKENAEGFALCYNKGSITNKQRLYPVGRRPLLTGGDMKAISRAARAAKAIEGKTKQLQRMGMLRKPSRGRARPRLQQPPFIKVLESGPGSVQV